MSSTDLSRQSCLTIARAMSRLAIFSGHWFTEIRATGWSAEKSGSPDDLRTLIDQANLAHNMTTIGSLVDRVLDGQSDLVPALERELAYHTWSFKVAIRTETTVRRRDILLSGVEALQALDLAIEDLKP